MNENHPVRFEILWQAFQAVEADLPDNINAFKHGLAPIQRRRENTLRLRLEKLVYWNSGILNGSR
jgi:hypothetical protein